MFQVGDTVFYNGQGVYRITAVEKSKLFGKVEEYFVLQSVFRLQTKIYIPLENTVLVEKMRPVLTADAVRQYLNDWTAVSPKWIANEADRKQYASAALASNDQSQYLQLFKMLYAEQNRRKGDNRHLHQGDEITLQRVKGLICDEFAFALQQRPEEIEAELLQDLAKSR